MDTKSKKDILKNIIWSVITIVIAILTITAITSQAKGFSVNDAWSLIRHGEKGFMVLAMFLVILYIYLEGAAIRHILKHISVKTGHRQAFLYSAADIYFSAITPSASGGQPASFYFMRKDGISFSKA
ncbi:MAG: lysylphosphatidylglycerol synthase transmembrane domain-containing protein, partial [Catonella sp.]